MPLYYFWIIILTIFSLKNIFVQGFYLKEMFIACETVCIFKLVRQCVSLNL